MIDVNILSDHDDDYDDDDICVEATPFELLLEVF